MIQSHFDPTMGEATIVLQPNHSWTWRANLYLLASLMVVSVTVALVLLSMGYWVVLPFTLLELSFLTGCLYFCVNKTHVQEVIRITQERLVLERGIRTPRQRLNVARFFARFLVLPGRFRNDDKTLAVRANNQTIPIGSFLTVEEKEQLIKLLQRTIAQFNH